MTVGPLQGKVWLHLGASVPEHATQLAERAGGVVLQGPIRYRRGHELVRSRLPVMLQHDGKPLAERDKPCNVGGRNADVLSDVGGSWISGGDENLWTDRILAEFPGESVFPSARSNDEDPHRHPECSSFSPHQPPVGWVGGFGQP